MARCRWALHVSSECAKAADFVQKTLCRLCAEDLWVETNVSGEKALTPRRIVGETAASWEKAPSVGYPHEFLPVARDFLLPLPAIRQAVLYAPEEALHQHQWQPTRTRTVLRMRLRMHMRMWSQVLQMAHCDAAATLHWVGWKLIGRRAAWAWQATVRIRNTAILVSPCQHGAVQTTYVPQNTPLQTTVSCIPSLRVQNAARPAAASPLTNAWERSSRIRPPSLVPRLLLVL